MFCKLLQAFALFEMDFQFGSIKNSSCPTSPNDHHMVFYSYYNPRPSHATTILAQCIPLLCVLYWNISTLTFQRRFGRTTLQAWIIPRGQIYLPAP